MKGEAHDPTCFSTSQVVFFFKESGFIFLFYDAHNSIFFFFSETTGNSNGCSNNPDTCQQFCLPTPNAQFTCACATGFRLSADNRTCTLYNSFIVVSMLTAIKGFSLETADHSEAMVPMAGRGGSCDLGNLQQ